MPPFMLVLIPYINLLKLSWIIKCLFLRNMEPLNQCHYTVNTVKVMLSRSVNLLIFFLGRLSPLNN